MAYKLILTDRFMDSDYVPAVCLFSGRTDEVTAKKMKFVYSPPSATAGFLVGGLLVGALLQKRFSFEIPAAPKERFKWAFKKNIWAAPFFLLPLIFCFAVVPFVNPSSQAPVFAGLIGLGLGVVALFGGMIWAWATQISFKTVDEGEVQVRIPERLKSVYEAYDLAIKTYTEERRKRRKARGGSGDGGADDPDEEEDWADNGAANWDEGKK